MPEKVDNLEDLLNDLKHTGNEKTVSIGAVLDKFQHRSLGVLLALLGLITVLPIIGDIPGAAIVCATLTLLAVLQWFRGAGTLPVPGLLRRREMSREKFDRAVEAALPWARRIDRLVKPRLGVLATGQAQKLAIIATAALLALSLYPLAFVPFGANAPGAGLIALGLGLMTRDGLLILIGYVASGVAGYVLVAALSSGIG